MSTPTTGLNRTDAPSRFARTRTRGLPEEFGIRSVSDCVSGAQLDHHVVVSALQILQTANRIIDAAGSLREFPPFFFRARRERQITSAQRIDRDLRVWARSPSGIKPEGTYSG